MSVRLPGRKNCGETLQDLVRALAARVDAPFILSVHGEAVETRTCADVANEALRLARGLIADGVQPGEPIAVIGSNSAELVVVRLALAAVGVLAMPIDDLSSAEEVAAYMRDSGAHRIFTSAAHEDDIRAACKDRETDIRVIDSGDSERSWRALMSEGKEEALPEQSPDDPTVLVYTSGTTGSPKGFTLTHANILHNVKALCETGLVGHDDRVLMPLPLHHAYPFVVGLLFPAACGATIVLPEAVRGPEIMRALQQTSASAMVGVPRLYEALAQGIEARVAARGAMARIVFRAFLALSDGVRRLTGRRIGRWLFALVHRQMAPALKLMASGGAQLEGKTAARLENLGWACYSGYGLAETASIFTGNRPGHQRIGSEGRPLRGGELRIADKDETGVGEIQLRGANVFSGYRNNEDANRDAFTDDGWFRTGDLGCVDEDGYLFVTGRSKEMIVLGGGKNVFPEEIEAQLQQDPHIREVAVFEQGGRLLALVVPDLDAIAQAHGRKIEDVVRISLSEASHKLASFKRPSGFAISRDPLPRTRLGKIRRFLLPELYADARAGKVVKRESEPLSSEDTALVAEPPARDVWRWFHERYPDQGISPDTNLDLDLGIDSVEWITLSLELERQFSIRLSDEQITQIMTLRDLLVAAGEAKHSTTAAPSQEDQRTDAVKRYLRSKRWWEALLGATLFRLNRILCGMLFRMDISGLDKLPQEGAFILIANHVSDLDPPVLAACLPRSVLRRLWWSGVAERLFRNGFLASLSRAVNMFPVEERAPERSLALAVAVLERGDALMWFPESWRSPDGTLQRFLPGIGIIVDQASVPCVPVRITGTFEAMPRGAHLPCPHRIRVRIGTPIRAEELLAVADAADNRERAIADALREKFAAIEA